MPATCDGSCDCKESVGDLLDYLQRWSFGSVIEKAPGETIDRDVLHDRMAHRAFVDPAFRRELFANPRLVYMIALEAALGIKKLDYVCQVKEVRVLEETPEILYVVVPTCHYGCQAEGVTEAPVETAGACHVCGMTLGPGQQGCGTAEEPRRDLGGRAAERREIERLLLDRVARDPSFRETLLFTPGATYREFTRELCGDEPAYLEGVREIRVLSETDRSIYFRLPAIDPLGRVEAASRTEVATFA